MQITLPSGTNAVIEKSVSNRRELGLVVIPDVMGLRPLFYDMVKRLAAEWNITVCSFELYPELEYLNVEERLGAASRLEDTRVIGDAIEAADAIQSDQVAILGCCMSKLPFDILRIFCMVQTNSRNHFKYPKTNASKFELVLNSQKYNSSFAPARQQRINR